MSTSVSSKCSQIVLASLWNFCIRTRTAVSLDFVYRAPELTMSLYSAIRAMLPMPLLVLGPLFAVALRKVSVG